MKRPQPTIKRSRAAELLDRTTRTLVNYEKAGLLTPIKRNCRSVVYLEAEVTALAAGQVNWPTTTAKVIMPLPRSLAGTFQRKGAIQC